jgi:ubiquinone/menaquinone biosynthesis C-methylase UbiE
MRSHDMMHGRAGPLGHGTTDHPMCGSGTCAEAVAARRRFFDAMAAQWDARVATHAFMARLHAAVDTLGIGGSETVLDLGCGTGNLTCVLAGRLHDNASIMAVDISTAMLDIARNKLPGDGRVRWVQADALSLPLDDAVLDRVICFSTWPHFSDAAAVAAELLRVLRPGGVLHVLHVDGRDTINRIHGDAGAAVARDALPPATTLAALLAAAGFVPRLLRDESDHYLVTVARPETT